MIKSTLSAQKLAGKLLNQAVRYNFCFGGFAPLDPRKHTTMSHNRHNMYMDLWHFGKYPDWWHNCSTSPTTYQPQVVDIIVSTINQRYGTSITPEVIAAKGERDWSKFLAKDLKVSEQFHELYPAILGNLAKGIFVRESRYTWVIEQQVRFEFSLKSFDVEAPKTVQDFLDKYNQNIETLILFSNLGLAAEIDQAQSPLEKHFNSEKQAGTSQGVEELKNLKGEHDNLLNRLLAYFH